MGMLTPGRRDPFAKEEHRLLPANPPSGRTNGREILGGFRRRGVQLDNPGDLGELQDALDHPFHSGQAQRTSQLIKPAQTSHDGPNAGAIDIGHTRQVEDDPPLILANDLIHMLLDLLAVRSNADAASHLEDNNVPPDLFFEEFHGFLRLTLCIGPPRAAANGSPARPHPFYLSSS